MTPCVDCGTPATTDRCPDCDEWAAMDRRLRAYEKGLEVKPRHPIRGKRMLTAPQFAWQCARAGDYRRSTRPEFIPSDVFRSWVTVSFLNKIARVDGILVSSYIARCCNKGKPIKNINNLYRFIDICARAKAECCSITQPENISIPHDIEKLKIELSELKKEISGRKHFLEVVNYGIELTGETLLSNDEIIKARNPLPEKTGIYFLIKDSRVVYVGQSVSLFSRIATHIRERQKDFDSYSFLPCEKKSLDLTESLYIHALHPPLNGSTGQIRLDELIRRHSP